jgi:hypothetical protein
MREVGECLVMARIDCTRQMDAVSLWWAAREVWMERV